MPQIMPIKELRNTNEISKICHEKTEPVYITKNGYGDMVIMSMETYEETLAKIRLYDKLTQSEKDLKDGKVLDAENVFSSLRKKHFE